MKPVSYHHHFVIPYHNGGSQWIGFEAYFPYLTREELFASIFSNLAFMIEDGWAVGTGEGKSEVERFREALHMLVTLVVSDFEGMSPTPQEFDVNEIETLHELTKQLLWDLWVIVDEPCWQHIQLNFVRLLPDAFLVAYHGFAPFRTREHNPFLPALLSDI